MKKLIALILLALLCCACADKAESAPVPTPPAMVTEEPSTQPTPSPSLSPVPTPTPIPTPRPLEIEGGAAMARFEDEETGDYLDYWLIVPENAVEGMPLLVFLHGDGNRALPESLEYNALRCSIDEIYGGEAPFLTLMPNTRLYSWTQDSIDDTLVDLVEHIAESCICDTSKILLTGHSRGAIGTWYLISTYPELFSAAAPVSCGCDEILDYDAMAQVPVWGFAGNIGRDGTHYLPAMERIAEKINDAGGNAKIDVLDGCDHAAAERAAYTEELFDWLLSQ